MHVVSFAMIVATLRGWAEHWLNTLFCVLKNVVFKVGQGRVFAVGLPLADVPWRRANGVCTPFAAAGPSRGFVTGVPRAYQGGCTLIYVLSILVVFKMFKILFLLFHLLAAGGWPLAAGC
jgi:hypothetical protein